MRQDRSNDNLSKFIDLGPRGETEMERPKTKWRRTIEKERDEAGWRSWNEVRTVAADRQRWKSSIKALIVTGNFSHTLIDSCN